MTLAPLLLGIMMLAVFALTAGGIVLIRRGERKRGVLMLIAAIVLFGNVLIWSL